MPTYVLAYSGGLDTSVILKYLKERDGAEIVTMTADLGQEKELIGVREKALTTGAKQVFIDDLREEFVNDYLWPSLKAGAMYQEVYPLATALAIYPTKALAQDQYRGFAELCEQVEGLDALAGPYDGDTPQHQRRKLRDRGSVILTNPDMLHMGILPFITVRQDFRPARNPNRNRIMLQTRPISFRRAVTMVRNKRSMA